MANSLSATLCLILLSALALWSAQLSPSRSQPATAQTTPAQSNPTVAQAPPPSQVPTQQASPQTSQIGVPLVDFMQYEKFMMDQTKQHLDFLGQENTRNLDFLMKETEQFKSLINEVFVAGSIAIGAIVSVLTFFGYNSIKKIKKEADTALEEAAKDAIQSAAEKLKTISEEAVQREGERLTQAVHERITEHKSGVDTTIRISNENQQRWAKEISTGLSQDKFNEEIRRLNLLWEDPHNKDYNMWLIDLIRSSGAKLDLADTVDEAIDAVDKTKTPYDVIIADTLDLFEKLKSRDEYQKYLKIVNTGADDLKKYKDIAKQKQIEVYAVVDTDASLLRAILRKHKG